MEKTNHEKRTEILESAAKLFSESGFERTTVDEIAAKANVGKGTIYLYFQNKEDIFLAIMEEGLAKLINLFKLITESGSFIQQMREIIMTHFKFIEDNQDFYKILLKEQVGLNLHHENTENNLTCLHQSLYELITNFIRKGMNEGYVKPGPLDSYVAAVSGMVSHTAFFWLITGGKDSLVSKTDSVLNIILYGMVNHAMVDPNQNVSGGALNVS